MAEYSFCESVHATSFSKWHIRELTDEGKKLGGNIDTPSLCGRIEKGKGWDLDVDMGKTMVTDTNNPPGICLECWKKYRGRDA